MWIPSFRQMALIIVLGLLALVIFAFALATVRGDAVTQPAIEPRIVTNLICQVEPDTYNDVYYTRSNGVTAVSGTCLIRAFVGRTLCLAWPTQPGRVYTLEYSEDLTDPTDWTDVRVRIIGDGTTQRWFVTTDEVAKRFYRLQVE